MCENVGYSLFKNLGNSVNLLVNRDKAYAVIDKGRIDMQWTPSEFLGTKN